MAKKSFAKLSNLYTTKQINELREELIKKHGNQCAICDKPREHFKKNFAVDHSHASGRVRGLLCFRCNKFVLGRHTLESVLRLLVYLLKYDLPLIAGEKWEELKRIAV